MKLEHDKRKALGHHEDLRANVSAVIHALETRECSEDDTICRLRDAQKDIDGIGDYLGNVLEAQYYNERRSSTLAIATRVFAVPELLELILLHVDFRDVVNAYEVDRNMRDTIAASAALLEKLHLRPVASKTYTVLPIEACLEDRDYRGLRCSYEVRNGEPCLTFRFRRLGKQPFAAIGSRWLDMSVLQPAVKEMEVFTECEECAAGGRCHQDDRGYKVLKTLKSETGITMGDLWSEKKEFAASLSGHNSWTKAEYIYFSHQSKDLTASFKAGRVHYEKPWAQATSGSTHGENCWCDQCIGHC